MWQINLGSEILYYPANEEYTVFETNLNEEVGLAGEFTFKVPPTNPLYGSLVNGAIITILRDGKEFWRGEINDIHTDFQKIAEIYCVEDLAWLGDEFLPPVSITNQTYAQRFQAAINSYNQNRGNDRQFAIGYISNVTSTAICSWVTEYEWSILDCLRNCICKDNGYLRVRRVANGGSVIRYIDIVKLEDYGVAATQPIQYGYNLLDYVKESDFGNLTNVLTPYGAELDDQEVYTDYSKRLQGTTIQNSTSINLYGRHAKAVIFDDVSNVNSLNALASSYLSRYSQPQLTMEVSAVDLAEIEAIDSINLGDSVQIIAQPFGIDQWLYLTQIQRDLQDISKNTITLSGYVQKGKTLTSQTAEMADAVENIPTKSSILEAAKKNALNMLLDSTQGGYVVFEYDANDNMTAVNILNAKTIEESTKRWRWAQNGFGYMSRANTSASWTGPTVAMTMNGEIVADFITTGSLSANRMRGGTLRLGGSSNGDYKNGSLYIYNDQDKVVGIWNRNGITIYDGNGTASSNVVGRWNTNGIDINYGDINLGNGKFHVTNAGVLTAQQATITGTISGSTISGKTKFEMSAQNSTKDTTMNWGGTWADSLNVVVNNNTEAGLGVSRKNYQFTQAVYMHYNDVRLYNNDPNPLYAQWGSNQFSDKRLKTNIRELDSETLQKFYGKLNPVIFNYKKEVNEEGTHFGVFAQDVEEALDAISIDDAKLVYEDGETGYKKLSYCNTIGIQMGAVKDLYEITQKQQNEINLLKQEIELLKERSKVNG